MRVSEALDTGSIPVGRASGFDKAAPRLQWISARLAALGFFCKTLPAIRDAPRKLADAHPRRAPRLD